MEFLFCFFFRWLLLLLLRRTCCVCRGVKMLTECSYSLHKHLNPQTKKIYIHTHIKSHTHTHFSFCISRQQVAHSFVLCLTCNAVHTQSTLPVSLFALCYCRSCLRVAPKPLSLVALAALETHNTVIKSTNKLVLMHRYTPTFTCVCISMQGCSVRFEAGDVTRIK